MFKGFSGFKGLNAQITELSRVFASIDCCEAIATFLCTRFGVDREYYSDWLCSKDIRDIAELVILYLEDDKREAIYREFRQLAAIN